MKKNIFFAFATLICLSASAFDSKKTTKPVVTEKMEQLLANQFGTPLNVNWKIGKNSSIEADLQINGQKVTAFFGSDGEYICSTTPINKERLPLKLKVAISNKLPNVNVLEIVEMNSENETSYFFQGVDGSKIKIWKGTSSGTIELVQKF